MLLSLKQIIRILFFTVTDGNQFVDIADEVGLTGKNDVGIDGDRGY